MTDHPVPPPVPQPPHWQPPQWQPPAPPPPLPGQWSAPGGGFPGPPPWPTMVVQRVPPVPCRIRGHAIAAIVTALLVGAAEVAVAIAAWPSGAAYGRGWQNEGNADVTASWDYAYPFLIPTLLAAYVAGALWLWQARYNVDAMPPAVRQVRSRGWVWGAWVTPVVNLWFPYQVVRDAVRSTVPAFSRASIGLWWGFWLSWLLTEPWVSALVFQEAPSSTHLLGVVETLDAAACIGALVLWVLMIRQVSTAQEGWVDQRDRELAASSPWARRA